MGRDIKKDLGMMQELVLAVLLKKLVGFSSRLELQAYK